MGLSPVDIAAKALEAPLPLVSFFHVPPNVFIGEDFEFTISFDNNHTVDAGFGPFIDLVFPYNGADGAASTDVPDGVDFINAKYLGTAVTSTVQTFGDDDGALGPGTSGCVSHPYALDTGGSRVQVCGTAGDKLVTLQLPFGSFTADQPAADVVISASLSNLADLGVPLPIYARGGFQYGADALNNPATDPSIISSPSSDSSTWVPVSNINPALIVVDKTNNLPEGETATGPNYPRRFTVTLDIPEGQVLNNVVLTDYLPNNLQYLNFISATPAGYTIDHEPLAGAPQNQVPDALDLTYDKNELSVSWPTITCGAGSVDARFVFEFFAPEFDADGLSIILHAWGEYQQYEVRSVELVAPEDIQVLGHKDENWLTLITCKEYDETLGAYRWRVAVQAVLVSSQPEP